MREPKVLRKRYWQVPQQTPLEILFATYGDTVIEDKTIVVTEECIERQRNLSPKMDRFGFRTTDKLHEIFGCKDPSPGRTKQLRMRYRIDGVHGLLILDCEVNNSLIEKFLLITNQSKDSKKYLRIFEARYGHPKGMRFDSFF